MATSSRSPRQHPAVVELENVALAFATRGGRLHAENDLDAVAAQDVAECLTQRARLARKQVRRAFDEYHLAAQPTNRLRHLYANRPASEHQQPPGDTFMPVASRLVQIPSRPRGPARAG